MGLGSPIGAGRGGEGLVSWVFRYLSVSPGLSLSPTSPPHVSAPSLVPERVTMASSLDTERSETKKLGGGLPYPLLTPPRAPPILTPAPARVHPLVGRARPLANPTDSQGSRPDSHRMRDRRAEPSR